jgi:hypothetical protein
MTFCPSTVKIQHHKTQLYKTRLIFLKRCPKFKKKSKKSKNLKNLKNLKKISNLNLNLKIKN